MAKEYIKKFGAKYNVRPHWGKMSWFGMDHARFIYPHVEDFLKVRERMDPNCQFVNQFLIDHFELAQCQSIYEAPFFANYSGVGLIVVLMAVAIPCVIMSFQEDLKTQAGREVVAKRLLQLLLDLHKRLYQVWLHSLPVFESLRASWNDALRKNN